MSDNIVRDLIDTSISVGRADVDVDVLRHFEAAILYHDESGTDEIGTMSGWIGWQILDEYIFDAADPISTDAASLGAVADAIIEAHSDLFIDNVLLIDRMHLEQKWRGYRLSRTIIHDLLSLLRFDPGFTVTVLQPEPQQPGGGAYANGTERDVVMTKLQAAYRASGLKPWRETGIWWLPFTSES